MLCFNILIKLYLLFIENGGFKTVFSQDQEKILYSYILDMESKLFALNIFDICSLAYELSDRLKLKHRFSKEKRRAGPDWLFCFRKRFPKLVLRKPEPTSAARASGFNKEAVSSFFKLATSVMMEYGFKAENIYNCDETCITVVPKSCGKVIALKGKKQVGCMTSAERGELVTAEICFSASGKYMPPLLIFPRKRFNAEYLNGAPPGAYAEFHSSGWMQTDIFCRWFKSL